MSDFQLEIALSLFNSACFPSIVFSSSIAQDGHSERSQREQQQTFEGNTQNLNLAMMWATPPCSARCRFSASLQQRHLDHLRPNLH